MAVTATERRGAVVHVVPADADERRRIGDLAERLIGETKRRQCPSLAELDCLGRRLLSQLELPEHYLGFAMVTIDNAFWCEQFAAIPYEQRLLLLPHCLRHVEDCRGQYDGRGLTCARCGRCRIGAIQAEAEGLGYQVIVAEGTPVVVREIMNGTTCAVLGVACLESLEAAFDGVNRLGIPHVSIPLLGAGCIETELDDELVNSFMRLSVPRPTLPIASYVPLLKQSRELFTDKELAGLLATVAGPDTSALGASLQETEELGHDWLAGDGKRFRPFVTLATHAVLTAGSSVLHAIDTVDDLFSPAVKRLGLAIEILHKASLVHDDVEDGDQLRYGRETLLQSHGMAVAINVGDYLVGLGYQVIAACLPELGAPCVAEIIAHVAGAHVRLARGQGAELAERRKEPAQWRPDTLQAIYALKTAPAFEAAFYVGMRSVAPVTTMAQPLRRFSRFLGIAYQVDNDLSDLDEQRGLRSSTDLARALMRPTLLRAFASAKEDTAIEQRLREIETADCPPEEQVRRLRQAFEEIGIIAMAHDYVRTCRQRALETIDSVEHEDLGELMRYVLQVVLGSHY